MRSRGRKADELRPVSITRRFTAHAEGSVLIAFGDTKVICNASFEAGVPPFLKGQGRGWVTAEYGMLPRATGARMRREATLPKQGGRTLEIQRLVGRALRTAIRLDELGENTIILDCDVIQADGGTRTAAVTGAYVALSDAVDTALEKGLLETNPLCARLAAVSVGIVDDTPLLDLDYGEDSRAETDMNVVMNAQGGFVEIQGTAEGRPFTRRELDRLLTLAAGGIDTLFARQNEALNSETPKP